MAAGRTLLLAVLVACGAKPPEALVQPKPLALTPGSASYRDVIAWPRPELDLSAVLPDPTEESRWPLTMGSHPVLEPQFDIAAALAVSGVTWMQLCARGAQHRQNPAQRELYDYLSGWCDAAERHADAALGHLGPLHSSVVLGMPTAVRLDIANVLADYGGSDQAMKLIVHNHLVNAEQLDLLAATYFEIGDYASSLDITNEAIAADPTPRDAARCHRAARKIMLVDPAQRPLLLDELLRFITVRHAAKQDVDPICVTLEQELQCWADPGTQCGRYFLAHGFSDWAASLVGAYAHWPTEPAMWTTWWEIVERVRHAVPQAGADELGVAAMEAALRVSHCHPKRLDAIRSTTSMIMDNPRHSHELDARLGVLLQVTPESCDPLAQEP